MNELSGKAISKIAERKHRDRYSLDRTGAEKFRAMKSTKCTHCGGEPGIECKTASGKLLPVNDPIHMARWRDYRAN